MLPAFLCIWQISSGLCASVNCQLGFCFHFRPWKMPPCVVIPTGKRTSEKCRHANARKKICSYQTFLSHLQAKQHCPHAGFLKNSCISKYNVELQVKEKYISLWSRVNVKDWLKFFYSSLHTQTLGTHTLFGGKEVKSLPFPTQFIFILNTKLSFCVLLLTYHLLHSVW